ncbi:MAG: NYN domain-containing protein [Clostridia bacterium]|nr:NYN domain-containing protein [Clostridia bacterium]
MIKIGFLFGRNKKKKPKAVAFIDYEHWYISMEKLYNMKPDLQSWVNSIMEMADVKEIIFFADFSNPSIANEIPKIRGFSNKIIETRNVNPKNEKDFTDFIMLDHIYQQAFQDDGTEMFIIFTGDAHFNSVVAFLKTFCKKQVGVFGVKGAFSNQLKMSASWWMEIPTADDLDKIYCDMILKNFKYLESKGNPKGKITFEKTVQTVSKYNKVKPESISKAMNDLIARGYIVRKTEYVKGSKVVSLKADFKKLAKDGLWVNGD